MQVPLLASCIGGFTQKDGATVAKLRHIDAELMTRIQHGKRLHRRRQHTATEERGELRPLCFSKIEIDEIGGGSVETDQIRRRREGGGIQFGVKRLWKTGIRVVKREGFELTIAHRSSMPGLTGSLQLESLGQGPEGAMRERCCRMVLPGGFQARGRLVDERRKLLALEVVDPKVTGQNGVHPTVEIDLFSTELQGDRGMRSEMI